jgi:hypothetical protein
VACWRRRIDRAPALHITERLQETPEKTAWACGGLASS